MNIIKRSGKEVRFDAEKILNAITKANLEVSADKRLSDEQIRAITDKVTEDCRNLTRAANVEEIQDMVENGPSEENMQKVREYLNRTYTENLKKNGYWSSIIQSKVRRGLDFHTGYLEFVNSVTSADVQAMAKKEFQSGKRI